jgi:polysaccharide biosynthesis protein PslG
MRSRILAGMVLAALISGAAAASTADARQQFLGVVYADYQLPDQDLSRMSHGRIGSVRWPLFWTVAEPSQGDYKWEYTDGVIGALASRGIRVLPTVYATPPYAGSTPAKPPLGSQNARRGWRRFLRQLVNRYGHHGEYWTNPALYQSQHPGGPVIPVTAWQIWNEPNLPKYFDARNPVQKYAKLVRISHRSIRARNPRARIVLAGLAGFAKARAWNFLGRLYRRPGIKRKFDAVALHPYAHTLHQFRYSIRRMREAMKQHHDTHTSLWITEMGWGSGPPDGTFNKGPQGQKRLLKRSFKLLLRRRHHWNIQHAFWFQWRDPQSPVPGCTLCSVTGLFEANGTPKPAWQAFKHFTGAAP